MFSQSDNQEAVKPAVIAAIQTCCHALTAPITNRPLSLSLSRLSHVIAQKDNPTTNREPTSQLPNPSPNQTSTTFLVLSRVKQPNPRYQAFRKTNARYPSLRKAFFKEEHLRDPASFRPAILPARRWGQSLVLCALRLFACYLFFSLFLHPIENLRGFCLDFLRVARWMTMLASPTVTTPAIGGTG